MLAKPAAFLCSNPPRPATYPATDAEAPLSACGWHLSMDLEHRVGEAVRGWGVVIGTDTAFMFGDLAVVGNARYVGRHDTEALARALENICATRGVPGV